MTPSQQPYHWQPRWLITFGNQATVEVIDATGVISHYYNYVLSQQLLTTNLPAGPTLAEATALQTAGVVLQASHQPASELAATPTDQNFQMTDPPTQAGDQWMITWARQYGSIPYRQEQATVILQAETGAVQAFSLSFPAAPPAVGAGSVTTAQATQTAFWGGSYDRGTRGQCRSFLLRFPKLKVLLGWGGGAFPLKIISQSAMIYKAEGHAVQSIEH